MLAQVTITDRAAAAVFAAPLPAKIVQTLIGEEMTLARLARAIDVPLSLLHYHMSKCVRLGLIAVSHETPRAGRAVKHYRATAQTFFVPAALITRMPGAEMTRQLRDALDHHQGRTMAGVNFTHDGRNPCTFLVKDSHGPATAIELWLDAGLVGADSAALIEEMKTLLERYRARGDDVQPRYLVHLAAVKVQG